MRSGDKLKFHSTMQLHPMFNGSEWLTTEWFGVETPTDLVFIPKGFIFDFASIPRSLWFALGSPATGKHRRAAFVHDWLYASQKVDRSKADTLFLEIMKNDGVSFIKRRLLYTGVRVGGWAAWNSKDLENLEANCKLQEEQFKNNSLSANHIYCI